MENVGFGGSSPLNPELYVTTMRTTTVNVRVKAPLYTRLTIDESFTVTAGVIKKLTFDSDIRVTGDVLTNKGIWVIADDEIVIYGVSPETYSNDAFLGLPTDVMGKEYYVVTWWPPEFQCELMVVGINDSTTVNVRLSDALGSSTVTYNGVNYVKGDTITITLNRYQTLQLTSDGDLTGTYITSDKIVSVFSGNKKTKVDSGTSSDHLVEQWPPVFAYGKRFVTVPIPERTTGDKFKFVASENDTHVTITGNSYSDSFTLSEPGSHAEKDIPSGTNYYCYVQSDKPILVAQFCKSQASKSEKADPMMAFIPPIEQYTADYTFATPQYSGSGSYTNYFMFIVKDAQKSGLRVDGSAFPGSTVYTPVPGTDLVAGFIQVSDGTHTIRHTSPISVFGGYLYGTANYESYGFPTGTRVAPINAVSI
ncbi:hypothetical protein KUTeg_012385 [Tegillarca granosa]|uniref:IgGFc-binding protein N-terminal domain-containing protein n=1 Tax=Tegillarca granosa TaxID=220873 RepID=A0ABQ9EZC9_TEGGR|nr:hypothetical protein KUTeg_012385 [Tegillarca granosa]